MLFVYGLIEGIDGAVRGFHVMYFRPGLRSFSESSSAFLSHPSSSPFIPLKFRRNSFPLSVPVILNVPASIIETGDLSHSNVGRDNEFCRRARIPVVSPPFLRSPGWSMSLSSSSTAAAIEGAGSAQMSPSEVKPVVADGAESTLAESSPELEDVIVQYIVIRKDLVVGLNWPLGSVISQGCHAAVAAIWLHRDDPVTSQYCAPENVDNMHKVTLEVKGEAQLRTLAERLKSGGILHKLWVEQPENYATCLATKPYYKSQVSSHFRKLKLCK